MVNTNNYHDLILRSPFFLLSQGHNTITQATNQVAIKDHIEL